MTGFALPFLEYIFAIVPEAGICAICPSNIFLWIVEPELRKSAGNASLSFFGTVHLNTPLAKSALYTVCIIYVFIWDALTAYTCYACACPWTGVCMCVQTNSGATWLGFVSRYCCLTRCGATHIRTAYPWQIFHLTVQCRYVHFLPRAYIHVHIPSLYFCIFGMNLYMPHYQHFSPRLPGHTTDTSSRVDWLRYNENLVHKI